MFDQRTQPHAETYFTPGSPDAIVWERTNLLRGAIARATNTMAAVSPEILYAPVTTVETEQPSAPTPTAGEVALVNSVSEVPETPVDQPTILDADPIHELSQEMFIEAARRDVLEAHQSDQEFANAA